MAGVLLGFVVPVTARPRRRGGPAGRPDHPGPHAGLAEHLEHRWRPVSAGLAVPVFAIFAAGVSLHGVDPGRLLDDPVVIGVVAGLVIGKALGVFGSTWLVARFTHAERDAIDRDGDGVPDVYQAGEA